MTISQNDGFTVVLNRVTGQATYSADADTFSSEIDIFSDQVNDQATEMNATAIEVNQASVAAVGAANYKGVWVDATGSASIGESFLHENVVWALNVNVADITLSEPSSVNNDWRSIDSSLYQYAVSQFADGDFSKVAIIYAGLLIDAYDYVVYQDDGRIYNSQNVTGVFSSPLDFNPDTGLDSGLSAVLENISRNEIIIETVVDVSQAFTPDVRTKHIEIIATGAGGGGGGANGQGSGQAAQGAGGAGGATSIITTSVIDASYVIIIGSGGSGGSVAGGVGGTGGATTVTSTSISLNALGGEGGNGMVGTATYRSSTGGIGGISSGGDLNLSGGDGYTSIVAGGEAYATGKSGESFWGGGRRERIGAVSGFSAVNPGTGGAGATAQETNTASLGGAAADGVVIIKEYL